jgi:hypothetical protein
MWDLNTLVFDGIFSFDIGHNACNSLNNCLNSDKTVLFVSSTFIFRSRRFVNAKNRLGVLIIRPELVFLPHYFQIYIFRYLDQQPCLRQFLFQCLLNQSKDAVQDLYNLSYHLQLAAKPINGSGPLLQLNCLFFWKFLLL